MSWTTAGSYWSNPSIEARSFCLSLRRLNLRFRRDLCCGGDHGAQLVSGRPDDHDMRKEEVVDSFGP
jgi:hypothetical protein